jgi:hypothetical protein
MIFIGLEGNATCVMNFFRAVTHPVLMTLAETRLFNRRHAVNGRDLSNVLFKVPISIRASRKHRNSCRSFEQFHDERSG